MSEYFCQFHQRWMVDVSDHPLFGRLKSGGRKWVQKARVVMAEKLNRRLLPSEIVHHRDEDSTNDEPENLEVKTRGGHLKAHDPGQFADWSKKSDEAKARCTPEWRAAVSERVKRQHAEGKFGRQTWREK